MKGIILAGGSGTRLYPVTKAVSKQLLPIYDKPMIYYPLSVLMLADIRDILVITTPEDQHAFQMLLGTGSDLGLKISYAIQEEPKGLADAFIIAEKFIGKEDVCLVLGDNIFYGSRFVGELQEARYENEGATIFGYYVKNPERYGVIDFDEHGKAKRIIEKPKELVSYYAVPGLYFFDHRVVDIAKQIQPSERGELEITELHNKYIEMNALKVKLFGRGMAWFDTGTHSSLIRASNFVETIQSRQGFYIACLEEIAYIKGYIDKEQLLALAEPLKKTDYGRYLVELVDVL
ncbi:glucose-1-phosphate thymidylyltransferase RfbA [Vallitaleaceae bacterium 9-2]